MDRGPEPTRDLIERDESRLTDPAMGSCGVVRGVVREVGLCLLPSAYTAAACDLLDDVDVDSLGIETSNFPMHPFRDNQLPDVSS